MSATSEDLVHRIVFFCLRVAQPEFFRRIQVFGQPLDDRREHLIVVANHPYGIQDAFLISCCYTRPFCFAATAMNFQTRVGDTIKKRRLRGWFLSQCHVLPIVRNRTEGNMADNLRTFKRAADRVAGGEALGIFAEGDSRGNQWQLLKLKSGTAQIALQVAELLKTQGGELKIQVVGLTYTNWDKPFKSSVTLRFAEPFAVRPVEMDNKQAVRAARKTITDEITRLMEELTVHIPPERHGLVSKVAQFYSFAQRDDFIRLREVGRKVAELAGQDGAELRDLEEKLDEYLGLADQLKIYPGEERTHRNKLLLLVAALPAYVGYLVHWPIMWATRRMVPRENTELHALGSQQVMTGINLTLAWYALISVLALIALTWRFGVEGIPLGLGLVVILGACGLIASRTFRHVNLMLLGILPGPRRFKRYRRLSNQLFRRLEQYRKRGGSPFLGRVR